MADQRLTDRLPPAPPGERMQRVRVGVTGLAAVILIVTLATAIASGVSRRAGLIGNQPTATGNTTQSANSSDHAEPLAQLGVAPGAAEKDSATAARKR